MCKAQEILNVQQCHMIIEKFLKHMQFKALEVISFRCLDAEACCVDDVVK